MGIIRFEGEYMDKLQIKSSPIDAQAAIGELTGVDVSQNENKQVEFSYSAGIAGKLPPCLKNVM